MLYEELAHQITQEFPLPPTALQQEAILSIAKFILSPAPNEVFILRGYAGTGKTTLVGALVRAVKKFQRDVVLLAPTGRAAKVFATHALLEPHNREAEAEGTDESRRRAYDGDNPTIPF